MRTIYFVCPDMKTPSGGVKQIYKQVDILNQNGFNAFVLHRSKGFRIKWFKNDTKIEYNRPIFMLIRHKIKENINSSIKKKFNTISLFIQNKLSKKLDPNGILVFPEIYGPYINDIRKDLSKVIFNQNCYYTFIRNLMDESEIKNPYESNETIATIVVSEDSKNYLKFAFPKINLFRIKIGIDNSIFHFSPNKKKQIAFMPRKLNEDVIQIEKILNNRNKINDWNFISIDNKSEEEVATIMKESFIYLSFNQTEGFGLPPVEAMACGCIVIGYTGFGGNEYFNPEYSYPIEDRNIISFSKTIEEVASKIDNEDYSTIIKGKLASDTILKTYSQENESIEIIKTWKTILNIK